MKNVIIYVRVSTDEQASKGYSLRDQEQKLINYCSHNNYNIVHTFREDFSAKTFKRPEFKKLLDFCKKNKKTIDELIFIKWDRFSRNTSESYQMISIFNDLNIGINAIEQPLDLSVPEQGLMLAVYLAVPQVENHRRSLNVISGMRRAFKEGRYVGSAPKGYSNGQDANKKPLLIPDENSKFIQEGFELMATGLYNQIEVLNKLKIKGFNMSKNAFSSLLKNHLYYGSVYIKSYKEEKEIIVDGLHEPIITKALFDEVQDVISGRKKQFHTKHKKLNPLFPLKGFLMCPNCQKPLTASTSQGRSKHYSYYHCISPCNGRYSIEDTDVWFLDFLKSISLKSPIQKLFIEMIKEELNLQLGKNQLGPKHYEQIKQMESRLEKLQDAFLEGDISKEDYHSGKLRYHSILDELKLKEEEKSSKEEILKLIKEVTNKTENIDIQYKNSDIEDKRRIIGSIFQNNFRFENKKVRTADINPIIFKMSSINGSSQSKNKWDKSKKIDLSHRVNCAGFEPAITIVLTN